MPSGLSRSNATRWSAFRCLATAIAVALFLRPPAEAAMLIEDEYRLEQYLQTIPYSPNIAPIKDKTKSQKFLFAFHPVSLVELDGAKQVIKVMGMLSIQWHDEILVWDKTRFNVTYVRRRPDKVWYPNVYIYNGNSILKPELPVSLYHSTSSLTKAYALYKQTFEVNCQMNMSTFPYDTQVCKIILVVDYDTENRLELMVRDKERNYSAAYFAHSEWHLAELSSNPEDLWFNFSQKNESNVLPAFVVRMKFERLGLYYTRNIVIPVTMLTILQMLVFVIPIESNEKITFGVTLLLAFTIYMLLFEKLIPKAPTVPAIFSFITSAFVLSAVSVLLSCFVLVVYYLHEDIPMPVWLHVLLFEVLAKGLCFCLPAQRRRQPVQLPETSTLELNGHELRPQQPTAAVKPQLRHRWKLAAQVLERLLTVICGICVSVLLGNYYSTMI